MKYAIAGFRKDYSDWEIGNDLFVSDDSEYIAWWLPDFEFLSDTFSEWTIMCWDE